ncbi:MAG: hypothetical protein ACYC6T_02045 [Thermoleophilia bacterium]
MKTDSPLLSDTRDVVTLSALLREVIAEGRERPPQPVRVDIRFEKGCVCRLLRPEGLPVAAMHPAAGRPLMNDAALSGRDGRLGLEPVATTNREAVA